ncbi:MAG: hypothetical protein AAB587_01285 [Patescibacteria group bacterium]
MRKALLGMKNVTGEELPFLLRMVQTARIKAWYKAEVRERRSRIWNALMRGTERAREMGIPEQDHSSLPLFSSRLATR